MLVRMDACCEEAAQIRFWQTFPEETANIGIPGELVRAIERWGDITRAFADEFVIRACGRPSFVSAEVSAVTCSNGHQRYLVAIGKRLYFFIWRTNTLVGDYWTLDKDLAYVPRVRDKPWPGPEIVEEYATAVETYFGGKDLSGATFDKFNQIFIGSHPAAKLLYQQVVDMAELFILFHEFLHAAPPPPNLAVTFVPNLVGYDTLKGNRRARWFDELNRDANAINLLWIAATGQLNKSWGLSMPDAKKTAAGLIFSGSIAGLSTLMELERMKYGEVSPERASTDSVWSAHPPAEVRRNLISQFHQGLARRHLDEPTWQMIRDSVASMAHARDVLFDELIATRPDTVPRVRGD